MSATTYPIAAETAEHIGREVFGHVIDNEIVPSVDGRTMKVIDPATGEEVAVAAAAIAAGNCVVLKPAEQTPMTAVLMAEVARDAGLPPGVLNIVQGDGEAGAALVEHPGVDMISFTGSRQTGAAIQAAAA